MGATIVYVVGVILGVVAVLEILNQPISLISKILVSALVVVTSWIGIAVYYLLLRGNLTKWFR
jgi:disulfide bond formation protein DsbB